MANSTKGDSYYGAHLLDILAVTSENYSEVFSYWKSSLDLLNYPDHKRHVVDMGHLPQPFGYCTDSWRGAIDRQLKTVVSWIRDHIGQYFLHTDTDIQFFPRFLTVQVEWLQWMAERGIDMLFMRERTDVFPERRVSEVNAGFYIVHCNARTLKFWEKVMADELAYPKMDGCPPYTDQYHLNRGLNYCHGPFPQNGCFGVRWAVIPDHHCIWSEPKCKKEISCAAFHHAVNTSNKPMLLRRVREIVFEHQALPLSIQNSLASIHALKRQVLQFRETYHYFSCPSKPMSDEAMSRCGKLALESYELASVLSAHQPVDSNMDAGSLELASSNSSGETCAECSRRNQDWKALAWSPEDGKGYCIPCWQAWYGTGPPVALGSSERYIGTWEEDWENVF